LAVRNSRDTWFIALVVGALFNFRLNRRRDAALRNDETLGIAAALYGEILLMRERMALMAKVLSNREHYGEHEIDQQFIDDYTPSDPILYPALAPKLGLLPSDLVLEITRFYDNFETAKRNLSLLSEPRHVSAITW
jgi:hypothetical protein